MMTLSTTPEEANFEVDRAGELLKQAGAALRRGAHDVATTLCEEASASFVRTCGAMAPSVGRCEVLRSRIQHAISQYPAAMASAMRATAIFDARRDTEPTEVASDQLDVQARLAMAAAMVSLGAYGEALNMIVIALARYAPTLGARSHEIACLHHARAVTLQYLGRYVEAEAALARATVSIGADGGADTTATFARDFATLARMRGDLLTAIGAARRAVALRRCVNGRNTPLVAADLAALAAVLAELGQADEARTTYLEALRLYRATFGEQHFEIGSVFVSLAEICRCQGRLAEARDMATRAAAIYSWALPPLHPEHARALRCVALIKLDSGDLESALQLLLRAQEVYVATLPKRHPFLVELVELREMIALQPDADRI